MPEGGTRRGRRQVAGLSLAGITEAHGYDGDAGFVVKLVTVQLQPAAQAVAAGVVPGNTTGVYPRARSLPDNQYARAGTGPQHRVGPQRQRVLAMAAGANLRQQVRQLDLT